MAIRKTLVADIPLFKSHPRLRQSLISDEASELVKQWEITGYGQGHGQLLLRPTPAKARVQGTHRSY
jgi:hypothetical protein